jgi:hypothetical protein
MHTFPLYFPSSVFQPLRYSTVHVRFRPPFQLCVNFLQNFVKLTYTLGARNMGEHSYFLLIAWKIMFFWSKYFFILKKVVVKFGHLDQTLTTSSNLFSFDEVWSHKPNFDPLKWSGFILKQKIPKLLPKTSKYPKNRMLMAWGLFFNLVQNCQQVFYSAH